MASKDSKIVVSISAYSAISVLSFCREFINDDLSDEYQFEAIKEAVKELEETVAMQLTDEHWEEIHQTSQLNQLIGKEPPPKRA